MTDARALAPRPEDRRPRLARVDDRELDAPRLKTVLKLIYNTVVRLFHDPIGMILGSSFLLIMLWGTHGKVELLHAVWPAWQGPGSDPATRSSIIEAVPWDREWLSFLIGAILLVGVPVLLIKLVYKQRLADYGLALPPKDRRGFAWLAAGVLFAFSAPAFYLGAHDAAMRGIYPMYRGGFDALSQFVTYSLGYLLFFVVIEFIFRGYLLFGLFQFRDREAPAGIVGERGPLVFGYYAIFISMLSYTAWHLGKPLPELFGTLVWGIAAGTVVLASRSIWPIVAVHWLLNVLMDLVIWRNW